MLDFDVLVASAPTTAANLEGFCTGSGFKIRVLMTVNTVVLAPMPNPSVSTTKTANNGLFRMVRQL